MCYNQNTYFKDYYKLAETPMFKKQPNLKTSNNIKSSDKVEQGYSQQGPSVG